MKKNVGTKKKLKTHSHIPNNETVKALKSAAIGKNLIEYSTIEEFLNSLGVKHL